jgi:hypothetical protein
VKRGWDACYVAAKQQAPLGLRIEERIFRRWEMAIELEKAELQRILSSPQFRRATKLHRFLELVCDYKFQDRTQEINEYLIATAVFGKGPQFDPNEDSLVRVQAREVRRRLGEYYQNDGRSSKVVVSLPLGGYCPVFTREAEPPPVAVRKTPFLRSAWMTIGATVLACAALLFATDRERHKMLQGVVSAADRAPGRAMSPSVAKLWGRFLDSEVPTVLVLSNPEIGDCVEGKASGRSDDCVEQYTGMGEAVATHLITNMFRSARQTLIVKQSRMVNADDVKRYNLILLGGKQVNVWTRRLGQDLSINAGANTLSTDEAQRYTTVLNPQTGQLTRDRGLIALRKNPATSRWVLFLYGRHSQGTYAAAEASTDGPFLSQLQWPGSKPQIPDSFHVFLGVSVNDGIPEEPIPVAVRVP